MRGAGSSPCRSSGKAQFTGRKANPPQMRSYLRCIFGLATCTGRGSSGGAGALRASRRLFSLPLSAIPGSLFTSNRPLTFDPRCYIPGFPVMFPAHRAPPPPPLSHLAFKRGPVDLNFCRKCNFEHMHSFRLSALGLTLNCLSENGPNVLDAPEER